MAPISIQIKLTQFGNIFTYLYFEGVPEALEDPGETYVEGLS